MRPCQRMRDRLVGSDESAEDLALACVGQRRPQRSLADAAGHGGQQHPFRVQAMEDVVEAPTPFADQTPALDGELVVGHFTRGDRISSEFRDGPDVDVLRVEVDHEEAETTEAVARLAVGPGQQEAHLGFECLRCPDLATGHDPAAHAVLDCPCRDAAGVGAGVRFGDAEGDVEIAGRSSGRNASFSSGLPNFTTGWSPNMVRCSAVEPFMAAPEAATRFRTSAPSVMPRPPPPYSSGIAMPTQPPAAMAL